ncbi:Nucleotide-binding alpha-beta plait [Penicillium paradoxum]|uniref:Nucleotide-binding alpha-beta plait n=1 Tax=Penicillium paradoxum TaxID=176176 RepID=UPI00254922A3|nr:Nucleotide-binding alpha-beta plait [Penicillium paradoxum]KAJ5794901.1 Nucleotide-binding alpha-beta plait [Penicillium paradoxum]
MNSIRQVQALNKRELEHAIPPEASWHADYRDTAYIYIGGLPFDLSEGDIITIFSQYGEPVHVNLVRDKETGKSKGFAFLKYEDQRSTDLAVDNLGGATVMGRLLRVDHARYKRKDDEEEEDNVAKLMGESAISETRKGKEIGQIKDTEREERRPMLKEEKELEELIRNHDEEDPMKEFLVEEKKEEVARAIELWNSTKKSSRRRGDSRERSSRHHRRHRSRSPRERRHRDDRSPDRERRSRYRSSERGEKSRRDRSPKRSRSPESRRHRSDRDRHDRRR